MVGKMILPLLGGTPAVWSTCMVFFQAALLGGYAYAHATTAWLGVRRQTILHLALLAVPLAVLPLGVDPGRLPGGEVNPVLGVLALLSVSVGLPFFVVSATAPLLQQWFTHTGHRAALDPYFLYAASNLGSMLALLSYPALIEPRLRLRDAGWLAQTRLWTLGYLLFAVLIVLCALSVRRSVARAAARPEGAPSPLRASSELAAPDEIAKPAHVTSEQAESGPTLRRRLYWVALAFAPSSLLLGTTTYVTTDIAALPLLWVLPLAIYLLSFILAFGRWPAALHRIVKAATLPLVVLVLFFMISLYQPRNWVTALWHLLMLFVVALACHGELARDRPAPERLTEFYLLISVGGVLGGLVNALIAPVIFRSLLEYPLAMILACVLVASAALKPAPPGDRLPSAGAGGRRDPARAGLLLREHRAPCRHGLRRPRVRARLRPRHAVDQSDRTDAEQGLDLRCAARGLLSLAATPARPRRGAGRGVSGGELRRRAEQ